MPARGYQYYEVDSFPDWEVGHRFETIYQQSMLMGMVDEAPKTIITTVGLADHQDFKKYHVMHETYQKVRGRYRNEPIKVYIAQVEFHIYYHSAIRMMLVDAPRKLCKEMVDRLEKSKLKFLVIPRSIDLIRLGNDLRESIRGGWFGNLKVADVSTIGLFGSTVGESAEWDRYEQLGTLKTIDLALEIEDQMIRVKIMLNRGIVLFESFSESEALELILQLQKLLDAYAVSG